MSHRHPPGWQLPVIGPWISRVGQVSDIVALPCTPSDEIWVEAFFAAAPVLLWSLFKPDFPDVRFSRGGLPHHMRGGKRGKKYVRTMSTTFEIPMFGGQNFQKGWQAVLFDLAELGQRIGWYLLIADAATRFALNWTSLAYQWAGCRKPFQSVMQARSGPWPENGSAPLQYYPQWEKQYDLGHLFDPNGAIVPAGKNCAVCLAANMNAFSGQPLGGFTGQLRDLTTGRIWNEHTVNLKPGMTGLTYGKFVRVGTYHLDRLFVWQWRVTGGADKWLDAGGSRLSCVEIDEVLVTKDGPLLPDP